MPSSTMSVTLVSKCTVFADQKSTVGDIKLRVSDLPMLSCHYIQKGGLFTRPPLPIPSLVPELKDGLSWALTQLPALAGRLITDDHGDVYVTRDDNAGAEFLFANAAHIHIRDILSPTDVPEPVKEFSLFDRIVSYDGHFKPILAVQVMELADGVFISCAVNCAVNRAVDVGTWFWDFFSEFAEGRVGMMRVPDLRRKSVLISDAAIGVPVGGPEERKTTAAATAEVIAGSRFTIETEHVEFCDFMGPPLHLPPQREDPVPEENPELRGREVDLTLKLFEDPWTILKTLTESDVNSHLCRLIVPRKDAEEHILGVWGDDDMRVTQVKMGQGARVRVWDFNTESEHELLFKLWPSSQSYVFVENWNKNFLKRRELKKGDEVGMYWDSASSRFYFIVFAPQRCA